MAGGSPGQQPTSGVLSLVTCYRRWTTGCADKKTTQRTLLHKYERAITEFKAEVNLLFAFGSGPRSAFRPNGRMILPRLRLSSRAQRGIQAPSLDPSLRSG